MNNKHDLRARKWAANPVLFEQLFRSFVDEPFVDGIDFSTIEDAKERFVTEGYKDRESDLIYKVKYQNRDAYIYILTEFQSTVNPLMSMRLLRYIMEFYDYLTSNFKLVGSGKLPPVFPLMIYNGEKKWNAVTNIKDLIEPGIINCKYIPDFSYYKIAENEFSDKFLEDVKNAVAAIFYIENARIEDLQTKFSKLRNIICDEKPEIIELLQDWFKNFMQKSENIDIVDDVFNPLTEDNKMTRLEASIEDLKKDMIALGMEQGKEQGLEQGLENKATEMALLMLKNNEPTDKISQYTGLSISQIKKLL